MICFFSCGLTLVLSEIHFPVVRLRVVALSPMVRFRKVWTHLGVH